jgi:hypothetical protein
MQQFISKKGHRHSLSASGQEAATTWSDASSGILCIV